MKHSNIKRKQRKVVDRLLYNMMHKNVPVMEIEIDEATGSIIKTGEIFQEAHLPLGVFGYKKEVNRAVLNHWWLGRSIPVSRTGIRNALDILEVSMPQMLIEKSIGLSLSDQYWICPAEKEIRWNDVNFFDLSFSEDVGNALFGRKTDSLELNFMSPDNTSDGWLKKKWKIIDGKRCLIKGGSGQAQQEPLNEVLASKLMQRIGTIHFVPYALLWEDGLPYSICENFITKDTELVSAWSICQILKKANHTSAYQHFLDCCEYLKIPNAEDSLNKMLTVDYLIVNSDRHWNNFGAVRNAKTLEWLGLAPIYDCGTSMWNDQPTSRISTDADGTPSKPFQPNHAKQINLVTSFEWLDFQRLDGLEEEYHKLLKESPYIDDFRRKKLCSALEIRIESLQELIAQLGQSKINDMEMK